MFQRRKKRDTFGQLQAIMFARKGWTRPFFYVWQRLKRRATSPRRVSVGFAIGAGVSFTPFMGFHWPIGYVLCLLLRGDLASMVVGTLVGNPWTFPFIWVSIFLVGRVLVGFFREEPLDDYDILSLSFTDVTERPMEIFFPMAIGGIILGTIAGIVFYHIVLKAVTTYQENRSHKIKSRRAELNKRLQALLQESDDNKK